MITVAMLYILVYMWIRQCSISKNKQIAIKMHLFSKPKKYGIDNIWGVFHLIISWFDTNILL